MIRPTLLALIALLILVGHWRELAAQSGSVETPSTPREQTDKLFATWSTPGSAGCALGVMQDGKLIYSRGYGFADIEHGAAIGPATIFNAASVSKQFTAMAIHLLAHDRRISLEDDVRKHLPELHAFGKAVTIRHLLHHTSGIRDYRDLLMLAGWRLGDVITQQDVLELLWRQKALNFEPGERYLYSNSGYVLLGEIVRRVSGKSLKDFAHEHMFAPLGMAHTQFHDDYAELVSGRALSYQPRRGRGYQHMAMSSSVVGPTNLLTTVDDLARWDDNFYTGRVGGKDLIARMHAKGILNSGREIAYAAGIEIGQYRGLKTVTHSGGDGGFRTFHMRFPDQHFSVITLCNAAEAVPQLLSAKVADLWLGSWLAPEASAPVTPAKVEVKVDAQLLDAYVGDYALRSNFIFTVKREGDHLVSQATGQRSFVLFPASESTFFPKEFDSLVTFDAPGAGGQSPAGTIRQDGQEFRGPRVERSRPDAQRLQSYVGTFFSGELNALYFVSVRDGKLYLRHPRGELELLSLKTDEFGGAAPVNRVQFNCTSSRRCDSFSLDSGRVQHLRFDRVDLSVAALPM